MLLFLFFGVAALLSLHIWIYPGWFDAGELALASQALGVAHAPGHPVYVMLGKLFTLLPLGSAAYRTALLSVVSTALAAVLVSYLLLWMMESLESRSIGLGRFLLVVGCAALVLLHPSIGLQATRTEVYAPQFALSLGIFLSFLLASLENSHRWILTGAFGLGLGMALQPLLTIVFCPLLLFALVTLEKGRGHALGLSAAFVFLGAAANLYLPIRAAADPILNWDNPSSLTGFYSALTARDFQVFFHSPAGSTDRLHLLKGDFWKLFPLIPLLLCVFGFVVVAWRGSKRFALLLAIAFTGGLAAWFSKDFHLRNPDAHAYASLPIALAVPLSIVGVFSLLKSMRLQTGWAMVLTFSVLMVSEFKLIREGPSAWKAHSGRGAEILSSHLDRAPAGAYLELGSDHWVFPVWYRTYVEQRRPDVAVAGTGMLRASWYRKQLEGRYGEWNPRTFWNEIPRDADQQPMGYLFGDSGDADLVRKRFNLECRSASSADPFRIRESVCAHVLMNLILPLLGRNETERAVFLLEEFLGLEPSKLSCSKPGILKLPFPFPERSGDAFLMDPDRPRVTLLLTYLACDRGDLAERLQ